MSLCHIADAQKSDGPGVNDNAASHYLELCDFREMP